MMQLYISSNSNYEMNGDYTLNPISCLANFKLNGTWDLEMIHPIDDKIEVLVVGSVISVNTPYGKKQLYRIYDVEKSLDNIICYAYPIFLDSRNDCFIWDKRPTNKNGQQALDELTQGSKYSAVSNIKTTSTAYYVQKNLVEAINSDDDNSFLKRWGGEVAYNNYEIIVNEKLGNDNGLRVEFGFNLLGVSEKVNDSNIVTRIIPKSYNGYILPNNETVDSPLINDYPVIHTKVIEYSDIKLAEDVQENEENVTICNSLNELYVALRSRAQEEYINGIDLPNITYDVDMVDLSKTDLYKDYKDLLKVNLGDTAHIKHRQLGIETTARVIELSYDCVTQKVESLILGDYEANYFNQTSDITHVVDKVVNVENSTLIANRISGVINLLTTSLKAQKDIAQRQDVRAILFEDLDINSSTFGALCIGTKGIQISEKRNSTNSDWIWGTAINFNSINADFIITGILTDKTGKFYLNLDTGELRMNDGTFAGSINIANNFVVSKDGKVFIKKGSIQIANNFNVDETGKLKANDVDITGKISATSGKIGGLEVNSNGLKYTRSNIPIGVIKGTMDFNMPTTENTETGLIFSWVLKPTQSGAADTINGYMYADRLQMMYADFDTVDAYDFVNKSSEKLKKNIQKIKSRAVDSIMNTDVCSYDYRKKKSKSKKYGFVLGDKYKVADEIVEYDDNNEKVGINLYSALALSFKAIQELKNEITELKKGAK